MSSEQSIVIEKAREAAQDRGAQLGMLSTQTDAYALGEAGLAAVRVVLEALIDLAAPGGNLDDALWDGRFATLLETCS